jgi:short subunit fatty acids transporter
MGPLITVYFAEAAERKGLRVDFPFLLAPFWVVVAAGIARIDFREIFGHLVVFAALWFGVGMFTFVQ